ncbi:MAG TPA: hypothetical protein VGK24_21550 [Candidatus Angelobacter sp.]
MISEQGQSLTAKPPNPITQGFRAVLRDPVIFLVEILWRWSFVLLALLLLCGVGLTLLGPLHIGNAWNSAWNSHDFRRIGPLVLTILLLLGTKAILAAAVVPVAIALLWSLLSAMGRSITVQRLRRDVTFLRFRSILALQCLRALVSWFSVVLLTAAILGEALIASRGGKPDLLLYYFMVMPSVVLIGAFWLILNWYLSLAAFFGRDGQSFRGALQQARQTVRLQRSDFAGTGFVFLFLRLVALLVALAICGLTSGMRGSQPQTYFTLLVIVGLVWCAVSDFLYMARMAAYLALAAAHVQPGGPKLVISSSLPVENPSQL